MPIRPRSDVSEGDLARATLHLYARHSAYQEGVQTLLQNPPPERFTGVEIAIGAAVLVALQLYVRFEWKGDGTWSLVIEDAVGRRRGAKPVVQKLLAFLNGPSS